MFVSSCIKGKRIRRISIFTLSIVGDFGGAWSPATGFDRSGTRRAGALKNRRPSGSCYTGLGIGRGHWNCWQLTFKEFIQRLQRAGTEAWPRERSQAGGTIEHRWSAAWHAALTVPVDWRWHIGLTASSARAAGTERRGRATCCKISEIIQKYIWCYITSQQSGCLNW